MSGNASGQSFDRLAMARFVGSAVLALLKQPSLIPTALRQAVRMAPQRWWASAPYLPLPSPAYLRFRAETLSGSPTELLSADELVVWLEWCRSMRGLPAT